MKKNKNSRAAILNSALALEGGLFVAEQLEKAALGQAEHQKDADYQLKPGLKIQDEASRGFQIAVALWKDFEKKVNLDPDPKAASLRFVQDFLRHVLDYPVLEIPGIDLDDRHYPIPLTAGSVAIVAISHEDNLDTALEELAVVGSGSRKKSAFQLAQEFLDASADHTWALACNGRTLRLLRDRSRISRPSYLEVQLHEILGGERYAEFCQVWRLLHHSRSSTPVGFPPGHTVWESWRTQGQDQGSRARENLRYGVTEALQLLGNGFLRHPQNQALRESLEDGTLSPMAYYQELLRLIYRMIFILSLEERGLLLQGNKDKSNLLARDRYTKGYALGRLRDLCLRDRTQQGKHHDLWDAQRIVWKGLALGLPALALPALGGLFDVDQCPHTATASLDNRSWLAALKRLKWSVTDGTTTPVDYANMDTEELGSVYESLLELVPFVSEGGQRFGFVGLDSEGSSSGNARKLSGSYYTPDSLVQELLNSALDPVIDNRLEEARKAAQLETWQELPGRLQSEISGGHSPRDWKLEWSRATAPQRMAWSMEAALLGTKVIDPACGSGHFLLGAARHLAVRLSQIRIPVDTPSPQDYRHALRDVVRHCIFGTDINPMAIELARMALWLEGYEEGKPLSFLDAHIQCGNALIGVFDPECVEIGIPADAYKPLTEDDKAVCTALKKKNKEAAEELSRGSKQGIAKREKELKSRLTAEQQKKYLGATELALQGSFLDDAPLTLAMPTLGDFAQLPEDDLNQISAKKRRFVSYRQDSAYLAQKLRYDLYVGAFFASKDKFHADVVPTSQDLLQLKMRMPLAPAKGEYATELSRQYQFLHWPIEFPDVFEHGGFDCVLGNPPWERIKLQEEEFFASREPLVVAAKNKAERAQRISWLAEGMLSRNLNPGTMTHLPPSSNEMAVYQEFCRARREAEAASVFAHVSQEDAGRFPLTGVGDVNLYALFSELVSVMVSAQGRAGIIVPSGIASDDSTKYYFKYLSEFEKIISLHSFENEEFIFKNVHHAFKFCLMTLSGKSTNNGKADFSFFLRNVGALKNDERHFYLSKDDISLLNPNTRTCPVFRSQFDAELTKKIYRAAPVLIDENKTDGNPWGIKFSTMFHMSNDSHLFRTKADLDALGGVAESAMFLVGNETYLPLYEAKMVHQYDHRWATYEANGVDSRDMTLPEKHDAHSSSLPRYWVEKHHVDQALVAKGWQKEWLLGWRGIARANDERSVIGAVFPLSGVGNSAHLLYLKVENEKTVVGFIGNISSLVFDYVARQKIGGANFNFFIPKQLPVIPPSKYTESDLAFITPRVLELTYTAWDLQPFARDLGYEGDPFPFDPDRRALLRAELDAYYAKLYGLTRDELRYILDPADLLGPDYPSETFRVLKNREMRELGEYRTQRLVLEAWDRLEKGVLL